MFSHSARYYDRLYSFKDYRSEVDYLIPVIERSCVSEGRKLLDIACGTGQHLRFLREHYAVEGCDINEELIAIARAALTDVTFHVADMTGLHIGRRYDIITCLFSSIGYVKTVESLRSTLSGIAGHLRPGGVLLVEPWFTPEQWHPGGVHAIFIDDPDLKIARVNNSSRTGTLSWFDFHYIIGTPEGTRSFVERHELGLFTVDEMIGAFQAAGLTVTFDTRGPSGRGLYIGTTSC